jgi:hypothetical protein
MPEMPTVEALDELTELAQRCPGLFVRWSRGPSADVMGASCDDLTGVPLPGLSANPLAVEPWWSDRPLRLWIARRLYDYSHLKHEKAPGVRPWILEGRKLGRGPDNEPLVRCDRPVAWIAGQVIDEAVHVIEEQNGRWARSGVRLASVTGWVRRTGGHERGHISAEPAGGEPGDAGTRRSMQVIRRLD